MSRVIIIILAIIIVLLSIILNIVWNIAKRVAEIYGAVFINRGRKDNERHGIYQKK